MSKKYSDLEKLIGISVLGALLGYSASKFMPKTSTTTASTRSSTPPPTERELWIWAVTNW